MDATTQAAIGGCNYVVGADDVGESYDPLGHKVRVLDHVGGMADDAGNDHFAVRQFHVVPHGPLVFVAGIRRFEGVATSVDRQHYLDDVTHGDVGGVRAVPAPPAQVESNPLGR